MKEGSNYDIIDAYCSLSRCREEISMVDQDLLRFKNHLESDAKKILGVLDSIAEKDRFDNGFKCVANRWARKFWILAQEIDSIIFKIGSNEYYGLDSESDSDSGSDVEEVL